MSFRSWSRGGRAVPGSRWCRSSKAPAAMCLALSPGCGSGCAAMTWRRRLESSALHPTLKAVEFRTDVHVGDFLVRQDLLALVGEFAARHHVAGLVSDPVVEAVSPHDGRLQVREPGGQAVAFVPRASPVVQEDRPALRIGLRMTEWAVREDELVVAFFDELKAMATRVRHSFGHTD